MSDWVVLGLWIASAVGVLLLFPFLIYYHRMSLIRERGEKAVYDQSHASVTNLLDLARARLCVRWWMALLWVLFMLFGFNFGAEVTASAVGMLEGTIHGNLTGNATIVGTLVGTMREWQIPSLTQLFMGFTFALGVGAAIIIGQKLLTLDEQAYEHIQTDLLPKINSEVCGNDPEVAQAIQESRFGIALLRDDGQIRRVLDKMGRLAEVKDETRHSTSDAVTTILSGILR